MRYLILLVCMLSFAQHAPPRVVELTRDEIQDYLDYRLRQLILCHDPYQRQLLHQEIGHLYYLRDKHQKNGNG